MKGCNKAHLETTVLWLERAWVSLHAPCAASAQLSLSHKQALLRWGFLLSPSESKCHPPSVEMKIFLAVGSSLTNTTPSSFFVPPIYFFLSLILDSI